MERNSKGLILGLLLGAVVGFVGGGLISGLVTWTLLAKKARSGWNLVPVVVASQDIPEGTVVTFDLLQQRSIPEQFVTSSVVKPEGAEHIVNQRLLVPVRAGDLLLWSQFEAKGTGTQQESPETKPEGVSAETP
jgi:Flp pilus assembly protein CpaB